MSSWRSAPGEDFTTGSWTVFKNADVKIVGINTARWDATKHLALPVVGDAREALTDLTGRIGDYRAPESWSDTASAEVSQYHAYIDKIAAPDANGDELPSYAQVVGVVDRLAGPDDFALAAAGGFPGEVNNGWRQKRSTASTASTASRAWATKSPVVGGRRWRCRTRTSPSSWVMVRT